MDLRHLRYFVAVAECGTFTRAAEQLHIEQPPLSQQIRQMEETLGLRLFDRSPRGASLTPAGEQLLRKSRTILMMWDEFHAFAHGLAHGEKGRVRVGMAGSVILLPIITQAVRAFRERWPDVVLTLEESNTPALCEALQLGRVDIAIIRPPAPDPNIVVRPFMDEPAVIALPKDHPRSGDRGLHLSDIRNEPLIIFERHVGPGFYDTILAACLKAGFSPRFGQPAPQVTAAIPMVAAGMGVSVVPAYLEQIHASGVTFHPILGPAPRATIAIASREEKLDLPVANFESVLRELSSEWSPKDVLQDSPESRS